MKRNKLSCGAEASIIYFEIVLATKKCTAVTRFDYLPDSNVTFLLPFLDLQDKKLILSALVKTFSLLL